MIRPNGPVVSNESESENASQEIRAVVAVGASAGGLEAIQGFFDSVPVNTDCSFVVIQHLSRNHESFMPQLLGRHTKMPVVSVDRPTDFEPNVIYLIKPGSDLYVSEGKIVPAAQGEGFHLPIDLFFNSLAQAFGSRAVGIVLSGTGRDGSEGLCAIREAGGLVMVQKPTSAQFDGMPTSAVATGVVEKVLDVHEMGPYLAKVLSDPDLLQISSEASRTRLGEVYNLILEKFDQDFSEYKLSTVLRRIERRMVDCRIEEFDDYVDHLKGSETELAELQRELLIGVTRFFRDPESFDALRGAIPVEELRCGPDGTVRVWCVGCATGEEAYSVMMVLEELLRERRPDLRLKIFATDLDPDAIATASKGEYRKSALAGLSQEQIDRYFEPVSPDTVRISGRARENVIFAAHDVTRNPPFTNIHLLTCRNLLIYFKPALQRRVLARLSFALRTKGILFLGPAESIGDLSADYTPVSTEHKIYQKVAHRTWLPQGFDRVPVVGVGSSGAQDSQAVERVEPEELVRTDLTRRYLPPGAITDTSGFVTFSFGDFPGLFRFPVSRDGIQILQLLPPESRAALTAALQKVRETHGAETVRSLQFSNREGQQVEADIEVLSYPAESSEDGRLVFIFHLEKDLHLLDQLSPDGVARKRIATLEETLSYTRETLQSTIEQLEVANEELQATNEELLASNEELQSTNEELHSVNEELHTVNAEYHAKNRELTQVAEDLDEVLEHSRVGTLVLDADLRILRFTGFVQSFVNVLESDVGRPLRDLSHNLDFGQLAEPAERCLKRSSTEEFSVTSHSGAWLILLFTTRRSSGGDRHVLLTILDVSGLQEEFQQSRATASAFSSAFSECFISDLNGAVAEDFFGGDSESDAESTSTVGERLGVEPSQLEVVWNRTRRGLPWRGSLSSLCGEGGESDRWSANSWVSFWPIPSTNDQGKRALCLLRAVVE